MYFSPRGEKIPKEPQGLSSLTLCATESHMHTAPGKLAFAHLRPSQHSPCVKAVRLLGNVFMSRTAEADGMYPQNFDSGRAVSLCILSGIFFLSGQEKVHILSLPRGKVRQK